VPKEKTELDQLLRERKKQEEMLRNSNALPESIKKKYISLAKDELGKLPPILLRIRAARMTRTNTRIPKYKERISRRDKKCLS
jgi:hypothetical protein